MTCPHGKKGSGHTMKAWNCADYECGYIVFAEVNCPIWKRLPKVDT